MGFKKAMKNNPEPFVTKQRVTENILLPHSANLLYGYLRLSLALMRCVRMQKAIISKNTLDVIGTGGGQAIFSFNLLKNIDGKFIVDGI